MSSLGRFCVALAVLSSALIGCGWQGPAIIELKDGTSIRCPNLLVTEAYLSCHGLEGGEHIYPTNTVARVTHPSS